MTETMPASGKLKAGRAARMRRAVPLRGLVALTAAAALFVGGARLRAASGSEVAVIYNRSGGPDSVFVAEHYAKVRGVPKQQLIGLSLPRKDTISRQEFDELLRRPLVKELRDRGLVDFRKMIVPAQEGKPGRVVTAIAGSRIRYLVLCYGVPVRIARVTGYNPAGVNPKDKAQPRNEAAVDSELAFLAGIEQGASIAGASRNPFYRVTDAARLSPKNGIFLVTRLDGPTADIARALVDKAVAAERDGLWGRAWFDLRGLKSGTYKKGDDWIRRASEVAREAGFETFVDERGAVLPEGFPLPQVALYAGWYTGQVAGPFKADQVEFMPGAIAYHLHSFAAAAIRSRTAYWVGPLLARGVTATLGCVYEPYLSTSPDVGVFFERLIRDGWTFGEAAYACQAVLSWQTTVVGDPLYRPAAVSLAERAIDLAGRTDEPAQWLVLQQLNRRLQTGLDPAAAAKELAAQPLARRSAILQEKLGDLEVATKRAAEAMRAWRLALDLDPSPEQRVQLQLKLARLQTQAGRPREALATYQRFFKENPRRPGRLAVYREALPVARQAKKSRAAREFERKIQDLTPPPKPAKK